MVTACYDRLVVEICWKLVIQDTSVHKFFRTQFTLRWLWLIEILLRFEGLDAHVDFVDGLLRQW